MKIDEVIEGALLDLKASKRADKFCGVDIVNVTLSKAGYKAVVSALEQQKRMHALTEYDEIHGTCVGCVAWVSCDVGTSPCDVVKQFLIEEGETE